MREMRKELPKKSATSEGTGLWENSEKALGILDGVKVEGHGQAKIMTQQEIRRVFAEGLLTDRDRGLFGVCLL